jgi:nucleoside-diphosphate-sugar epimerase
MILVVGATGQLGSAIVGKLVAAGQPVRIFVRPNSHYHHLIESGQVEVAFGDLRDKLSLEMACKGIETVVATANNVFPGNGAKGSFEEIEGQGYDNLIKACQQHSRAIYYPKESPGLTSPDINYHSE